jgi:uncharacterized protein YhhL (DUF1145 family)
MGIIEFIILCVVLGVIVWLVNKYAPIPQEIKTIILVAVIIVLIVVLLKATGILGGADVQIPRISK